MTRKWQPSENPAWCQSILETGFASFANDIASWLHPIPDGRAAGTGKKNTDFRVFTASCLPTPTSCEGGLVLAARFWSLSFVEYRKMPGGILSHEVLWAGRA